uniref:Uncharacterized protein n=1 Tax=Clastoptera arizonana TaxID=38151 RepID=A0A1B6BXL1_9HEMI
MFKTYYHKFIKYFLIIQVLIKPGLLEPEKFHLLFNISKFLNTMTLNAAEFVKEIGIALDNPNYKRRQYEVFRDDLSIEIEKIKAVIQLLDSENYTKTEESYTMFKKTKQYYKELLVIEKDPKEVRHQKISNFLNSLEFIRKVMDLTRKHGTRSPDYKIGPADFMK